MAHDGVIEQATCLGCGCTCDDVTVVVADGRISRVETACPVAEAWFGDGRVPAEALIAGRAVPRDEALSAIAVLLTRASRPLVYLSSDLTCEAQRQAIAVADRLRAAIDSLTSAAGLSAILAAQERGRASATLGEVRNRADVVVFWGVDPTATHPRFLSRYVPEAEGLHVPRGRRSRTVVAVDIGEARGPVDADLRLQVSPDREVEVLTRLAADADPGAEIGPIKKALRAGRYVGVVADGESATGGGRDPGRFAALGCLVSRLNDMTRGALLLLRDGGNRSGTDAALTAQTGYPAAVDFTRGYPSYRPYDGTAAARLDAGGVDAALVIGAPARLPSNLADRLQRVPCAVIGPHASRSAFADRHLIIDTAVAGIHESGTVVRMDDVPLPAVAVLDGPPGTAETVSALGAVLARAISAGASNARATREPA